MGNCVATRAKQNQKAQTPQTEAKIPEIEKREVKREFNDYETRKFKKILNLNFDRDSFFPLLLFQLRYRNQEGGFVTPDQMASILLEFKRFLFLAAISPARVETNKANKVIRQDLTPSPVVDRFWRLIMANTKLYEEICKPIFSAGNFPRDSRTLFNLTNYKKTLSMYRAYFGQGVSSIWPPYKEADQLERAHHGFMRLNLEHFIDFDRDFRMKINDLKDKEEIQKIYLVDIANLRTVSKLRLTDQDDDDTSSNASLLRSYYFKNSKQSLMDSIGSGSKIENMSGIKSPTQANKKSLFYQNNSIEEEREEDDLAGDRFRIESQGGSTVEADTLPPPTVTENKASIASVDVADYRSIGSIENYRPSSVEDNLKPQNIGSLVESLHDRKANLNQLVKNQALDDTIESEVADISEEDSKELIPTNTDNKEQSMAISVEVGGGMLMEDSRLQELNQNLNSQWEFLKTKLQGKLEAAKVPRIVKKNFRLEINVSDKLCDLIFNEYNRFLILKNIVKDEVRVLPPYYVMLAWEYHAIETKAYYRYCMGIFGKMQHVTQLSMEPTKEEVMDYAQTLVVYEHVFQSRPPPELWTPPQERFYYPNYNRYKMINIRGFMTTLVLQVLNKKRDTMAEIDQDYSRDMVVCVKGMQLENAATSQI